MSTPADVIAIARLEDACAVVSEWAAQERVDDLAQLARLLDAEPSPLADHVEDELASCPAALEVVLGRARAPRATTRTADDRVRMIASRLAATHPPDAFDAALAKTPHDELLACWMQELVVRGAALRADVFHEELAARGHPLAALPTTLTDVEVEVPSYAPGYGADALGRAYEALASGPMSARSMPPPANALDLRAREIASPPALATAVKPWAGPNGRLEARVFTLEPALRDDAFGRWLLRNLPLVSTREAKLDGSRIGVESAFGMLFAAACNGGASGSALGGAYGRLAAWASFAALVDTSGPAPDVARAARRAAFLSFSAAGPWFHDVAWDLGLVALRPGGGSVAVLAATDA